MTCELIFQLIKMLKEVFSSHCEKFKSAKMSVVVWQFLKNLKIQSPYGPAILLLGVHPKELNTGIVR